MKDTIGITLGEIVKNARNARNITQKELSKETSISRNYISDIECGRYIPSVNKLIILAKVLKIDLNLLLTNDGNTSKN
ncbi:hypothetical protein Z967_08345 [Clostridium novyi A str. 4540]|uniref:helix-turn-helix domain-containing protein n=1 Tax=Clostridium novyi TaxID=1542 RepID=UPI0004DA3897|nr:helix-turn-helix transcriptional regulator [Clostridium novyi]KEH89575.1 hypothetical protein Z967_08345 [Clostridium novyi A str. 4540]